MGQVNILYTTGRGDRVRGDRVTKERGIVTEGEERGGQGMRRQSNKGTGGSNRGRGDRVTKEQGIVTGEEETG